MAPCTVMKFVRLDTRATLATVFRASTRRTPRAQTRPHASKMETVAPIKKRVPCILRQVFQWLKRTH